MATPPSVWALIDSIAAKRESESAPSESWCSSLRVTAPDSRTVATGRDSEESMASRRIALSIIRVQAEEELMRAQIPLAGKRSPAARAQMSCCEMSSCEL